MTILNNIMGSSDVKVEDKIIAQDSLNGAKAAAGAYLTAGLESATPEVRRMFSEFLTQSMLSHETLTGLAVKRGWYQPYVQPEEQIAMAFEQAKTILTNVD